MSLPRKGNPFRITYHNYSHKKTPWGQDEKDRNVKLSNRNQHSLARNKDAKESEITNHDTIFKVE